MRSGLAVQTFYGHRNSCNCAVYSAGGTTIASSDADGVVKLWDVRMVAEVLTIQAGQYPANKLAFDPSGTVSSSGMGRTRLTSDRDVGRAHSGRGADLVVATSAVLPHALCTRAAATDPFLRAIAATATAAHTAHRYWRCQVMTGAWCATVHAAASC